MVVARLRARPRYKAADCSKPRSGGTNRRAHGVAATRLRGRARAKPWACAQARYTHGYSCFAANAAGETAMDGSPHLYNLYVRGRLESLNWGGSGRHRLDRLDRLNRLEGRVMFKIWSITFNGKLLDIATFPLREQEKVLAGFRAKTLKSVEIHLKSDSGIRRGEIGTLVLECTDTDSGITGCIHYPVLCVNDVHEDENGFYQLFNSTEYNSNLHYTVSI